MSVEQAAGKKPGERLGKEGLKSLISLAAFAAGGFFIASVHIYGRIVPFSFCVIGTFMTRNKGGDKLALAGVAGAAAAAGAAGAMRAFALYFVLLVVRAMRGGLTPALSGAVCAIVSLASGFAVNAFLREGVLAWTATGAESVAAFAGGYILRAGAVSPAGLMNSTERRVSSFLCAAVVYVAAAAGAASFIPDVFNAPLALIGVIVLCATMYFGAAEGIFVCVIYAVLFSASFSEGIVTCGILCVSASLSWLARDMDKFVGSLIFATGVSVCLYFTGDPTLRQDIIAVVASCALFALFARLHLDKARRKSAVMRSVGAAGLSEVAANRILQSEIELQKSMIREISKNMTETAPGKQTNPAKEVCRHLAADVCVDCEGYAQCWRTSPEETYEAVREVVAAYQENFSASYSAAPESFRTGCRHSMMLFKLICALVDSQRIKSNAQARTLRARRLMNEQFRHLSRVLDKIYIQFSKGLAVNPGESSDAAQALLGAGIEAESVVVMEDFYRRQKVFLTTLAPLSNEDVRSEIPRFLSDSLKCSLTYDYEFSMSNHTRTEHNYCYVEDYEYKITTGVRAGVKEDNTSSGDSSTSVTLSNGLHLMGLCDGMGSGEKAHAQSSRVLSMFEELINSGYDEKSAAQTVNSILVMDGGEEIFVTVDLFLFDLNKGLGEFVKGGASPSYVRRGGELAKIEMESLPLGILDEVHVKTSTKSFKRGDFLFFMSDGFFDSFANSEEAIRSKLLEYDYRNPQKLADQLFEDALSLTGGEAVDDITILVARIR